jgi:hypothetical protein
VLTARLTWEGIADRFAAAEYEVEPPFSGLDHDRAGVNLAIVAHDLAGARRDSSAHHREGGGKSDADTFDVCKEGSIRFAD